MANHPAPPLAVSESEAEALRAMTRAGTTEQRTALRAKVILRAAERFTRAWNTGASPFAWVKTHDEILAKAVRKPQAISGAGH